MATDLQDTINKNTTGTRGPMSTITGPQERAREAVQTTDPIQTTAEPGVISSKQGKDLVTKTDEKLGRIKADREDMLAQLDQAKQDLGKVQKSLDTKKETEGEKKAEDKVTFINPETGAEQTLRGDALTNKARTELENQGFVVAESDVAVGEKDPEIGILEQEAEDAKNELQRFNDKLEDQAISSRELRSTIRNIQKVYGARIDSMEEINRRRQDAIRTLGVRLGSRYTGGTKGVFGGVIAEEERQGLERIAQIEADMQAAIGEAEQAAREFNFTLYSESADRAEELFKDKKEALEALKTAQAEEQKKVEEEEERVAQQSEIISQISLGLTDPTEIFTSLGGAVPFDAIKEITDTLPSTEEKDLEFKTGSKYQPAGVFDPATGEFTPLGGLTSGGTVAGGNPPGTIGNGSVTPDGDRLSFNLNQVPSDPDLATMHVVTSIFSARASDGERELVRGVVERGIKANQTLGEIMMISAQFDPPPGQRKFGQRMMEVLEIAADKDEGLMDLGLGSIGRLLANGNRTGAVQRVEGQVMNTIRQREPDMQISEATARIFARQKDDFEQMLQEQIEIEKGGLFSEGKKVPLTQALSSATEGTVDEWLGRFREEEQSKIKNRVTEMTAKLRNDMLGSAVTPSEERFLEALIPKLGDQPEVFIDKVNRLAETPLVKLNEYRSLYGLPKINQTQLLNAEERVKLYEDQIYSSSQDMSNEELLKQIDMEAGFAPETSNGTDPNGYTF